MCSINGIWCARVALDSLAMYWPRGPIFRAGRIQMCAFSGPWWPEILTGLIDSGDGRISPHFRRRQVDLRWLMELRFGPHRTMKRYRRYSRVLFP